jgi:hypothetical protein
MFRRRIVLVDGAQRTAPSVVQGNAAVPSKETQTMARNSDPLLDAGIRGLIFNTVKKNYWRVANWLEFEDLIQDGYMLWCKVRRRYPDVHEIKHLTALFKTTFTRHIIDLSNEKRAGDEIALSQIVTRQDANTQAWEALLGTCPEEATLRCLLANAPAELKALWRFLNSEDGRARLNGRYRQRLSGHETNNEFLCRVLGFNPATTDFKKIAQEHFFPA